MAKAESVEKNTAGARKAYGMATANLRANNREEFNMLLDAAYVELGLLSPRAKRAERDVFSAEKRAAAAARKEEKRLAKIEALKAELTALEADPLF